MKSNAIHDKAATITEVLIYRDNIDYIVTRQFVKPTDIELWRPKFSSLYLLRDRK